MNKAYTQIKCIFFTLLLIMAAQGAEAAIYKTVNPGNWDDINTWDCACIPPNPLPSGDQATIETSVTIPSGVSKTVNTDATMAIGPGGNLIIEGALTVNVNATLRVVDGGTLSNTGTLNLSGSMSLENNPATLPGGTFNWITGIIEVTSGVSLTINSPFTIPAGCSMNLSTGTLVNNSTVNVNGSLGLLFGGSINNTNGTININSGGLLAHLFGNYGPITQGTFNWNNGGTLRTLFNASYTINSPTTVPSGRTLILDSGSSFVNNSTLTNNGTMKGEGSLTQSGTYAGSGKIAPGSSPGTFSITGSIDLGTGTYDCEINGTSPGTQHDVIAVTANATLTNASLVVDWGAFTPLTGQTYTIMTFGSRTGEFASVTIPSKGGLNWEATYTSTTVVVKEQSILPVEMGSFSANETNESVLLSWETFSEIQNKGFDVERSNDGKNWKSIAFINGQGTASGHRHYSYMDDEPHAHLNYYRLRQIDMDGNFTFSNIVTVAMKNGDATGELLVYPNPVRNGQLYLSVPATATGHGISIIYDSNGKKVSQSSLFLENGNPAEVNVGSLAKGVYVVELIIDRDRWQQRFIIE